MTDSRAMLEHLLGALRQAGHPEQADAFERQFSAVGWHVGPQEQLDVLAALQRATTAKLAHEAPTEPIEPIEPIERVQPLPAPPSRFQVLEGVGPWVATLRSAWRLVEAVHAVFEATSRHALQLALTKVFVDHLGLEPVSLDETDRLAHQTTLTHLSVIARHEDFFVLLVESRYAGHHLTSLDLPFRLHPRALVFAYECEHRIRVVTRRAAGSDSPITSRVLHGRGLRSFPEDDLLVWARRLALLEPGAHDDGRALARRAYDAIGQSATEIARAWDSCPLDPAHVPGPGWEDAPRQQVRQFLQPEAPEPRLAFGLEAELRSAFPWRSRDGVTIEYRGYVIRSLHDVAEDAVQRKQDTLAEIDLLLVHRGPEADVETLLTIPASTIVPDPSGLFVLRGERLVFVPGRATSGDSPLHAFDENTEDDDEDEAEDDTEAEAAAAAEGTTEASLLDADEIEEEQEEASSAENVADPAKYAGACLVPLLRWSVGRRLRWFGAKLLRSRRGTAGTPNAFEAWMGRWSDAAGRVRLSSTAVLAWHLQPPTSFRLRAIQVDLLGPPPAWACLELSRALPPGSAYPVAGARIGPAGVLAAPIPHGPGVLRLSAATASPVSSNPRATSSAWNATRRPFIARALAAWAELPAGTLAEPLLVPHGRLLRGTFARAPGSRLVLRLLRRDALRERGVGHWHLDLPARVDLKDIEALCAAGDPIAPGAPLLELDGRTWGSDPRPREHRLLNVAKSIQQTKSREKLPWLRVHAPPSLTGRLDPARPVSIEAVVNGDDHVIIRRASFSSHHHIWPDRAVLPDGRAALIEWALPEDLPWNEASGEVATGVLLDPCVPEATSDAPSDWRDGTTGEPIEAPVVLEVALVGQRLVPPDPDLRARVLDGWGHPRSPDDPHLTYGELRWLEASRPSQAAAIHRVAEATHGTIAPGTTIIELSLASHVPLPFFVRDVADTDQEPRSLPPYDPTRSPRPTAWCEDRPPGGPWVWRCACGQLRGSARAQERCVTCNEPVTRHFEAEAQHVIDLPYPIIHPWRRSLLAALLGITVDELRAITDSEECSELAALTEIALRQPLRSLRERLSRTQERGRRLALLLQLEALEGALRHGLVASDLWLTRLRVLSPRLLFDGYRLGAPDLLESPLTKHYRSILSVVKLAQGRIDSLPELRQAHWIELQKRVDELFGSLGNAPASGTLAELWLRVWPTTAPRSIPLAVPGLFCRASGRELLAFDTTRVWADAEVLRPHTARLTRGLLGPEGPLEIDTMTAPAIDPRDEQAWLERGAWGYLSGPGLVGLAAILLGIDGDARVAARVRALLPTSAVELASVGPLLLEQLVRGLEPPRGCPSRLVRLLLARTPFVLPSDDDAARRLLGDRLLGIVDPNDRGASVARAALTTVLCGFWHGAPTPSHPSGWAWAPSCSDAPSGFRRTVPRLSDTAWEQWPDFQLMVHPLDALRSGAAKRSSCAGTGAWFGLAFGERPVDIDWDEALIALEPSRPEPPPLALLTAQPAPIVPISRDPTIVEGPLDVSFLEAVVLDVSIAAWLTAHL